MRIYDPGCPGLWLGTYPGEIACFSFVKDDVFSPWFIKQAWSQGCSPVVVFQGGLCVFKCGCSEVVLYRVLCELCCAFVEVDAVSEVIDDVAMVNVDGIRVLRDTESEMRVCLYGGVCDIDKKAFSWSDSETVVGDDAVYDEGILTVFDEDAPLVVVVVVGCASV